MRAAKRSAFRLSCDAIMTRPDRVPISLHGQNGQNTRSSGTDTITMSTSNGTPSRQ